ncbi:SH3 domain-containing protein [Simonsiella muelleri]|uniref:SH3b domain-containing protein n=1 Tax=Simonsiella muelleri ATCC 29453 TaxID=641147 RepID=V9H6D5_9NEIS|nr:SH3 domain-containing protein [Simonsiella muelleri]AUX60809.1 SH3 domain-containing protein [Simonsiella muelleri ATCC 29453]EFG31615.1 hypothetical protein HMPREF9021_00010 [Simonsiella muelleri ATCC 29453]UBQ54367.1 SH3 domain-containing protein [Simonsiella muelleri]
MNKWISISLASLTAVALLSGCNNHDDRETKQQIAQLQAQLDAEKAEKAQRQAQENEQKQQQEQQEREEQIRQEAEESVRAQLKMEAEEKAAQQKAIQQQKAAQQKATPKMTEKIVRYPATVVTQSGYGDLSLRGEASTKGLEVGKVYDGNEVTVIAKTNKCEVIGNIDGCWVKVQLDSGVKGYMFDGYLNREVLSQEEKQNLRQNSQEDNE